VIDNIVTARRRMKLHWLPAEIAKLELHSGDGFPVYTVPDSAPEPGMMLIEARLSHDVTPKKRTVYE
jgi:hypothetical protein